MKFVELSSEEFNKVSNNFSNSNFYQSYEWSKLKESTGWKHYYVGVLKDNTLVAVTLILGKKIYFNKYLYYAPRGVLIDYSDTELLNFFIIEIKKFLIKRKGILFKIDPIIEYQKHDNDGTIVGPSDEKIINSLINIGFIHHGFTKGYNTNEIQMRWSYILNVNKSIEDIKKDMDQRCRRCIKKYERYPLELTYVDNISKLKDFKDIMESTAKRQNHFDRSLEYYNNLNRLLGNRSILTIIYLDKNKYLEECTDDKLYDIVKNDKRNKIPISAGVFIFDKDRLNYVYGGTYKEYMSLMAQYKMQVEMIKLTKEKNLPIYDFGGISGNFIPGSENYGVYKFKRGFGGNVIEYIGEFDLILDKFGYYIYDIGYKLYRNTKKVIAKILKR